MAARRSRKLKVWQSDLPQYFNRAEATEERVRTNRFQLGNRVEFDSLEELERYASRPLVAVERARRRLEEQGIDPAGCVFSCAIRSLAMGDVNATAVAQDFHVQLLADFGGMADGPEGVAMEYGRMLPRGPVHEGVYIDDHAVFAVSSARNDPSLAKAATLHNGA